jgi:folate-binding protein YgfZ
MSTTSPWAASADATALAAADRLSRLGPVDTSPLQGAAVFPADAWDRRLVGGRDRARFLHAMLSNDVQAAVQRGVGHGVRATLNTVQGRLVAAVFVYVLDPDPKSGRFLCVIDPGLGAVFVETLEKYVIAEKVRFEPDDGFALRLIAGREASRALTALGAVLPEAGPARHGETTVGGVAVRAFRTEWTGVDDWFLRVADVDAGALDAALSRLPRPGLDVLEAARIEAAVPRVGLDVTSQHIALEGGLKERAISFTKGCYIGQEVICRIDSIGEPARSLVQLRAGAAAPPGVPLFADGREAGYVTSSVDSRALGGAVMLGYLKKQARAAGTVVRVGAADGAEAVVRRLV